MKIYENTSIKLGQGTQVAKMLNQHKIIFVGCVYLLHNFVIVGGWLLCRTSKVDT